ncbi:hypothetical protein [Streptomyces sp. NPDC004284]|uniref:hypothetical protein n=1 Tax=Streptomyces sp. NPDC004284 TaxID=3364695 RepID=UPI00369AE8B1
MAGLVGRTGTAQDAEGVAQTATPSPAMLAISGSVQVHLSIDDTGPAIGKPCTPPPNAKTQIGMKVRVTDETGTTLGSQTIQNGLTRGSTLKACGLDFPFKVSGAPENYKLIAESFPPMP